MPRLANCLTAAAALTVLLAGPALANPNLVTNPGFETGDLTGWSGNGAHVNGSSYDEGVNSGSYAAFFGHVGSVAPISQVIATTAGQAYTFSFYFASDGGTPNEFQAYFDGTQVFESLNAPAFGYTLESFNVVASTASTAITFSGRNDPTYQGLDDVSVVAASTAVPEPATLALVAGGLLALGVLRRRQN